MKGKKAKVHCPACNAKQVSLRLGRWKDSRGFYVRCTNGCEETAIINALRDRGLLHPASELSVLLYEIAAHLKRYVVFPSPYHATAIALWVAHTHAIEAAEATPYLGITAPEKRSGKSRLLEALEQLVARAWLVIRPSEAVVYRKIDTDQPTMLLDEVDAIFKDKGAAYEGLRAALNAGYRRGATIPRCLSGRGTSIKNYKVFCPKAIAGIGDLPDTVADRSIPIRLARRAPEEVVERFRYREVAAQAAPFRRRLRAWAKSATVLRTARPQIPDALDDRAAEGWEPLLAIADAAGGTWPDRAREAAVALHSDGAARRDSEGIALLRAICEIFEDRGIDKIPSKTLVESLVQRDDGPWADRWEVAIQSGNTKGPGAGLARLLRPYRINSKPIRVNGKIEKGYKLEDFKEAFRRYLPRAAQAPPA